MAAMSNNEIEKHFETSEIVPSLIEEGPESELTIKYGSIGVIPGMELTPLQSKFQPELITWPANPDKFYALIMFGMLNKISSRIILKNQNIQISVKYNKSYFYLQILMP